MPLNPEAILGHRFPDQDVVLTPRDCMLYALSLGLARDPLDSDELCYVYEDGLQTFPTLPVVLGHPGPWTSDPAMGIDRRMLVHASQRLQLLAPLQPSAALVARTRVLEVVDKGESGAIVVSQRELREKDSGRLIARMESGSFCRADGGFGGRRELAHDFRAVPAGQPDAVIELPTDPNQALYYRLNGDFNPLHASPGYAAQAGFARPILHGLCTFGVAAHGLLKLAGFRRSLLSFEARFSKPVFPGETVRIETWQARDGIAFRASVAARSAVVLDRGWATLD